MVSTSNIYNNVYLHWHYHQQVERFEQQTIQHFLCVKKRLRF